MKTLTTIILNKIDLSLPYWSMYEDFLMKWDTDKELEESLKETSVSEIEETFKEIFKDYYSPDHRIVNKETMFKENKGMNIHKIVHALNTKGEHLFFNQTIGVSMSKTSLQKFLKLYTIDDITRPRLYCMFNNHPKPDDTFVKDLENIGVKWKPIEIKNPKRMSYRFPEISI